MKFFIDTANVDEIREAGAMGIICGVTTNPSLIAKEGRNFNEVIKDKPFYGDNGGVTFSGGEPLLQAQMLLPLLQMLKNENITTAVETSLFVPTKKLQMVIPFIDFFYDEKEGNFMYCSCR